MVRECRNDPLMLTLLLVVTMKRKAEDINYQYSKDDLDERLRTVRTSNWFLKSTLEETLEEKASLEKELALLVEWNDQSALVERTY